MDTADKTISSPSHTDAHPMLVEMNKNLKWTGIGYIILGIITCFGIITAIIGIPMIIAGIRAKDASSKLEQYLSTGSEVSYNSFFDDLAQHFKMLKIYFVIYLISIVVMILFYAAFFSFFMAAIMSEANL